jgi:hypothetical protein
MTDDRRASPRHTAYLAAEIDTGAGRQAIAITRDVGAGGLLVLTRLHLDLGQVVKLRVAYGDKDERVISGTVVRQETLAPGESTLWRTKVALSVEPGDPGHAAILEAIEHPPKP